MAILNKKALDSDSIYERNTIETYIDGFVFLPAGNSYLTRRCRALSMASHKIWFNVYPRSVGIGSWATRDGTPQRIGLLVNPAILETAKRLEEETRDARHALVAKRDTKDADLARNTLRELLLRIPEKDCDAIVARGWEKNSGRVGRTRKLELKEKVRLAAAAYIRHKYTDYDVKLKRALQVVSQGKGGSKLRVKKKKEVRRGSWATVVQKWMDWGGRKEVVNRGVKAEVQGPGVGVGTLQAVPGRENALERKTGKRNADVLIDEEVRAAKRLKVNPAAVGNGRRVEKDIVNLLSDDEGEAKKETTQEPHRPVTRKRKAEGAVFEEMQLGDDWDDRKLGKFGGGGEYGVWQMDG
ncbi:hypothetical protein BDZ91DRAFT_535855 [Kalaharituber pfeilii]|nr:hypothetical protein BDZ91DRAFT_535855 [Kalaharituber pfeilii]